MKRAHTLALNKYIKEENKEGDISKIEDISSWKDILKLIRDQPKGSLDNSRMLTAMTKIIREKEVKWDNNLILINPPQIQKIIADTFIELQMSKKKPEELIPVKMMEIVGKVQKGEIPLPFFIQNYDIIGDNLIVSMLHMIFVVDLSLRIPTMEQMKLQNPPVNYLEDFQKYKFLENQAGAVITILEVSNRFNLVLTYCAQIGNIKIWELESKEEVKLNLIQEIEIKDHGVQEICFSVDDRYLAIVNNKGSVKIFNIVEEIKKDESNENLNFTINYKQTGVIQPDSDNMKPRTINSVLLTNLRDDAQGNDDYSIVISRSFSQKELEERPRSWKKPANHNILEIIKLSDLKQKKISVRRVVSIHSHMIKRLRSAGPESNRIVMMLDSERDNIEIHKYEEGELHLEQVLSNFKGKPIEVESARDGQFIVGCGEDFSVRVWGKYLMDDGLHQDYQQIDSKKFYDISPESFKICNKSTWIVSKAQFGLGYSVLRLEEQLGRYDRKLNLRGIDTPITHIEESHDENNLFFIDSYNTHKIWRKDLNQENGDKFSLYSKNDEEVEGVIEVLSNPKEIMNKEDEDIEEGIHTGTFLDPKPNQPLTLVTCEGGHNLTVWIRDERTRSFKQGNFSSPFTIKVTEEGDYITAISVPLTPIGSDKEPMTDIPNTIATGDSKGVAKIFERTGTSYFNNLMTIDVKKIVEDKIRRDARDLENAGKVTPLMIVKEKFGPKPIKDFGINAIAISRMRNMLAVSLEDNKVAIFEIDIKKRGFNLIQIFDNHKLVTSIDLSQDGLTLVYGSQDTNIRVFELNKISKKEREFRIIQVIRAHKYPISKLKLYDNGMTLVSHGYDNKLMIWVRQSGFYHKEYSIDCNHVSCILSSKAKICELDLECESGQTIVEKYLRDEVNLPRSGILMNILDKMFDNNDSIITPFVFKQLIQYLRWLKPSIGELFFNTFVHSGINILFLAINTYQADIVEEVLDEFGYQHMFYGGIDPLKEVLKGYPQSVMDKFAEYFEKNGLKNLDESVFIGIINGDSTKLKQVAVKAYFENQSPLTFKYPDYLYLDFSFKEMIFESTSYTGDKQVEEQFKAISHPFLEYNPLYKKHQVEYRVTNFKADISLDSPYSISLLEGLSSSEDVILLGDIKSIVNKMWVRYSWIMVLYLIIKAFFVMYFLFSVTFNKFPTALNVINYIVLGILIIYELLTFSQSPLRYIKRYDNWMDIYLLISIPIFSSIVAKDNFDPVVQFNANGIMTLTMLLAGMRLIAQMKVFISTRLLLVIILQAVKDMIPFTSIMFICILIFSFVDVQATKQDGKGNNLAESLNIVYNTAFGGFESPETLSAVQIVNFIFNTAFFNLIMINLLIAIISKTYEDLQEKIEATVIRESVNYLLELAYIMKPFEFIFGEGDKFYLHYARVVKIGEQEAEEEEEEDAQSEE